MSKIGNLKVLVVGDVEGRFKLFCSKVAGLHQKNGPFEMVLCVGNFFGDNISEWSDLEKCTLEIPLPTYILGPTFPEHARFFRNRNGEDLVPNLTYLGRRGIFTFSSGLKSCLPQRTGMRRSGCQHRLDVQPEGLAQGIEKHGNETAADTTKSGSPLIAQLAGTIKPRYHFAGLLDLFYERTPYRNHQILAETTTHVSRFIGLAAVGNANKQRFLYAFNVIPMSKIPFHELRKQPDSCTQCPYERKPISTKADKVEDIMANQYFYDTISDPRDVNKRKGNFQDRGAKRHEQNQQRPEDVGKCWFCLSSPDAEKHLVVSVGLHTYIALAKGGLTADHVLILPITHLRSYPELDDEAATELEKYKASLIKFFADQNKSTVFFERNFKSKHMQLQVVPVPKTEPDRIKQLFLHRAEEGQLKLTEIPSRSDIRQIIKAGQTFFYVELDNGEKMFYKIDQKGFPLQFGRDVLAEKELLNMPDRIDWRECQNSRMEETEMANTFKAAFKPYDFNFEE
ncbi:CWF19-like protein 1 [Hypsibius exemplaris]|uniref:CWF19-like protein 1 n=1 Tax=Hypsibius exemplaris TaxID=2072580 RepID=A0A9X6NFB6_HYPEX|nr:CWF19-like protein 1 [Hypsibius exemplaris]